MNWTTWKAREKTLPVSFHFLATLLRQDGTKHINTKVFLLAIQQFSADIYFLLNVCKKHILQAMIQQLCCN